MRYTRGRTAKTGAGRQGVGAGKNSLGRWEKGGWEMGDDTPLPSISYINKCTPFYHIHSNLCRLIYFTV